MTSPESLRISSPDDDPAKFLCIVSLRPVLPEMMPSRLLSLQRGSGDREPVRTMDDASMASIIAAGSFHGSLLLRSKRRAPSFRKRRRPSPFRMTPMPLSDSLRISALSEPGSAPLSSLDL